MQTYREPDLKSVVDKQRREISELKDKVEHLESRQKPKKKPAKHWVAIAILFVLGFSVGMLLVTFMPQSLLVMVIVASFAWVCWPIRG